MTMKIDLSLLRQMVDDSGGIRLFCRKVGINRQTLYNIYDGSLPDYSTICRISEGLQLTGKQMVAVWFASKEW